MSESPIQRIEISLHIDTGNVIYGEFEDIESALEFVRTYHNNPEAILKRITPRKKSDQE